MKRYANLTPHAVTVFLEVGGAQLTRTYRPVGLARLAETYISEGSLDGVPIIRSRHGDVSGLPQKEPDRICIVSRLVCQALPGAR